MDHEIIIVDDGSTDESILKIPTTNNIKIIKQENSGVSTARNKGIKNASGKYIMFVDADDTIDLKLKKNMLVANDPDIICYNYFKNNQKVVVFKNDSCYTKTTKTSFIKLAFQNPTKMMMVWGKIFNKSFLKDNNLYFNENMRLSEDGDFMVKALISANDICCSTLAWYCYQNNPNSVMRTFDHNKVYDYLNAMSQTLNFVLKKGNKDMAYYFNFYILMHLNVMMVHEVFDVNNQASESEKRKQLKHIVNKLIIKEALDNVNISECNSIRMLPILLIKLKLYSLASILFKMRSKQNYRNEGVINK